MPTPPNSSFSKLTDPELESLIRDVFSNLEYATLQLRDCWNRPAAQQLSAHYREAVAVSSKDLESLLDVWKYRAESMR